jgi:hypothetical protein
MAFENVALIDAATGEGRGLGGVCGQQFPGSGEHGRPAGQGIDSTVQYQQRW